MSIPNIITFFRIAGTLCLLFTKPFSKIFYVIYTLSGVSDVLDGYIARKTNQISELGSKLDSIADLFFYIVMITKIFPELYDKLPGGIWYAVGFLVIVRIASYTVAAVKYKKFASLHTYMNKLTGFLTFIVPYFINYGFGALICYAVCAVAILAAFEELLIHICQKEYNTDMKTIFLLNKKIAN